METKTAPKIIYSLESMDPIEFEIKFIQNEVIIYATNSISKRKYENKFNVMGIKKMGIVKSLDLVFRLVQSALEKKNAKLQLYYGYLPSTTTNEGQSSEEAPGSGVSGSGVSSGSGSGEQDLKQILATLEKKEKEHCDLLLLITHIDEDNFIRDYYRFLLHEQERSESQRLADMIRDRKIETDQLRDEITQLKTEMKKSNVVVGAWRSSGKPKSGSMIKWNQPIISPLLEYLDITDEVSKFIFKVSGLYRISVRHEIKTSNYDSLSVQISGSTVSYARANASDWQSLSIHDIFLIDATQYLQTLINFNSDATSSHQSTFLSIELLQANFKEQKQS